MTGMMNRFFLAIATGLIASILAAALVVLLGIFGYQELRNIAPPAVAALAIFVAGAVATGCCVYGAGTFIKMAPLTTKRPGDAQEDIVSMLGREAAVAIKTHPYHAAALGLAMGFTLGRKRGVSNALIEEILHAILR